MFFKEANGESLNFGEVDKSTCVIANINNKISNNVLMVFFTFWWFQKFDKWGIKVFIITIINKRFQPLSFGPGLLFLCLRIPSFTFLGMFISIMISNECALTFAGSVRYFNKSMKHFMYVAWLPSHQWSILHSRERRKILSLMIS